MSDTIDLLQAKIDKAKLQLPEETRDAIANVDWKAAILGMRAKKGYTFEQLDDLEIETELLLCGLLDPKNYPKELEQRMKISKEAASQLVNEMNDLVFKKIREELIKKTEKKDVSSDVAPELPPVELVPEREETHPVLSKKFFNPVKTEVVETEHSLENISRKSNMMAVAEPEISAPKVVPPVPNTQTPPPAPKVYPPKSDPYRMNPDE